MRKNQKYTQSDMYAAIERCHKEEITYSQYCNQSGIHYATFKYWVQKYHQQNNESSKSPGASAFLPVKVLDAVPTSGNIIISYPNGLRIECPCTIPTVQLTTLLKYR